MNALLQLSRYIGAILAAILCIGLLTRSDIKLIEGQESSIMSALMPAEAGPVEDARVSTTDRIPDSYRTTESRIQRVELPSRPGNRSTRATALPVADRSSRPRASVDMEAWIELNVAQTFLEAEKETMSPGVILATGLYFLEAGQGDMSMNAADVAAYLAEVRENASRDAKKHMKYIANRHSTPTPTK